MSQHNQTATSEEIRLARRYIRFTTHLGNRTLARTGHGDSALRGGLRSAAYAEGWLYTVNKDGACRFSLRQATANAGTRKAVRS